MKRKRLILPFFLALLLLLSACGNDSGVIVTGGVNSADTVVPVRVESAYTTVMTDSLKLNGEIKAKEDVYVIPKASGTVQAVNCKVGDYVNKGDTLVVLDDSALEAQLVQAQAALAAARASYEDAVRNLERMEALYEEGAISLQTLESARTAVAASNPEAASASVDLAQLSISYTRVQAPISGLVAEVNTTVGSVAGTNYVARIVDMSTVTVTVEVGESEINQISVGQSVQVAVESAELNDLKGTVRTVSPVADYASKSYTVEIGIDNKDRLLKPGMYAEVKIVLGRREDVTCVPTVAVTHTADESYLFVVEDGHAVKKTVVTGAEADGVTEIVSGLLASETVVVKGQNKLTDGVAVSVEEE